jgi:3-hydroxyacyl-CoA dehydrogenase
VNESDKITIRRAAVLGAGVMGAQIAAHLVCAGIETILFDLFSEKEDANALVIQSIQALKKLKPSPLAYDGIERHIQPANYNTDLDKLKKCDLIIEAIAERMDWKQSLYQKVAPHINAEAIFATNTSGLSITELASHLPENIRNRFCGVHFFNPPRYMKLVEIIPHANNDLVKLNQLETFLVSRLGKGVIRAKDTPNFIGNRIGVFALLATLHHSEALGLTPDTVDALTGTLIQRPKSATFRTMDIVGLDTMAHVIHTLQKELKDDPWQRYFQLPHWIEQLIDKGALGQKRGVGIYKKVGKEIQVYDPQDHAYRPLHPQLDPNIPHQFLLKCQQSPHPQAQLLWRIFRDLFHYCAYHLEEIAHHASEIDFAMRWGYGWKQGPFETWQASDWKKIVEAIERDRKNALTMSDVPLPQWSIQTGFEGPYKGEALRSHELPVYRRQYFPDALLNQTFNEGETVFETDSVRMWTQGDRLPILSFKTKRNSISTEVLEGIQEAIDRAEKDFDALILWQRHDTDFSVGLDLKQLLNTLENHRSDLIEKAVSMFQKTAMRLRYASIPTVAAIRGLTLGGACEFSMHTTQVVAALETYIGLVEVRVGLLPAGAGTKEMALRAARKGMNGDLMIHLKKYFEQIAYAKVSQSGQDAFKLGYLRRKDHVVMNVDELLFVAKKKAASLADLAYHPPLPPQFPVAGKTGIANFKALLVNLREGNFITDYDYWMGAKIAHVLCGGEIEEGSLVNESWMLHLEREAIIELTQHSETVSKIRHVLKIGE